MDYTGAYEFNKVIRARGLDDNSRLVEVEKLRVNVVGNKIFTINSGFHAFRIFTKIIDCFKSRGIGYYSIIPRGSEYAIGNNGTIVSTQIIVFSNLWKYLKWKILK